MVFFSSAPRVFCWFSFSDIVVFLVLKSRQILCAAMAVVEEPVEHLYLKKMGVEVEEVAEGLKKQPLWRFSLVQVTRAVVAVVLAGEEPQKTMLLPQFLSL